MIRTRFFNKKNLAQESYREPNESRGFRIDGAIPVVGMSESDSFDDVVRKTVAEYKGITVDQVKDNMTLGEEGRSIVISLVFVTGRMISASVDTTVKDLIDQIRSEI